MLVLLGGEYAASLALAGAEVDAAAPVVAAGLLGVAELAYWSLELRGPGREDGRVLVRRLAALAALAVLSLAVGSFVLLAAAVPPGDGVLWDAVGVAAAAATLAIVAALARRGAG